MSEMSARILKEPREHGETPTFLVEILINGEVYYMLDESDARILGQVIREALKECEGRRVRWRVEQNDRALVFRDLRGLGAKPS